MINNLRPVTREKLSALCGGNLELIKFFENLFALTTALATEGQEELATLAGAADNKATQALATLESLANAINRAPQAASVEQVADLQGQIERVACHVAEAMQSGLFGPVVVPSVQQQGWASYSDGTYTSGSPFAVNGGTTADLPNDAATKIETYLPPDVETYYTGGAIRPRNVGDYQLIVIRFNATCTNPNTAIDFGVNIGGALGVIFKDTRVFPKGAGVEHSFSFVVPGYSLDTFVANGGVVRIGAVGGDVDLYDIEYQICRIYSGVQGQA